MRQLSRRGALLSLYIPLLCNLQACDQPPPAPQAVTPVQTITARAMAGANALAFSAEIQPETTVNLAFRSDGYVTDIATRKGVQGASRLLQTGDLVAAGEVLASIEDEEYRDKVQTAQANLAKAQADALKAKQDFSRASALKKSDSITGPDFDAAQAEYSSAEAAVSGAQAQLNEALIKLRDTRLVTPMAATVLERDIEKGTLVHSGSVGFVLGKIDAVKAVFGLPDTLLQAIAPGAAVQLHTASYQQRVFKGTVTEIAAVADPRVRLFDVSVTVQNADGALRPGMIATLGLAAEHAEAAVVGIPLAAIIDSGQGGFGVYVVQTGGDTSSVQLRAIQTGAVIDNQVVVLTGLQADEQVVIKGMAQLQDGQTVQVVPR